jgi:hypothetical protein
MLGFQIYVDWQEKTYMAGVLATGGHDSMSALKDFDFLLESVMPHKYFSLFLVKHDEQCEQSDLLYPYIIMIRKVKFVLSQK